MFRWFPPFLATNIPRSVWDPAQYNPNWPDSYGHEISSRREWPARKWSVGLEPRTPREWLQFSYRNLAYAYNGALRACQSLPSMLLLYKEMKQRGVKVDVDTMNVLLTRAARYEHIRVDDIFLLFDELTSLGARADLAAAETLHIVFNHSAAMPLEWREARRRQLIDLYNDLALEEIERLTPHHVDRLLMEQMRRYRNNLRLLDAGLRPAVYCRYFHVMNSATLLLEEVHNFLWDLVPSDHPAMEVPTLKLRVPFVASVLKRPSTQCEASHCIEGLSRDDFEDKDVCGVFLAAAERVVDAEFEDVRPMSERRVFLSLLTMISYSGVLYTSDLMAHLMEMVKYSRSNKTRNTDAQRLLRYAVRGSSAAQDDAYRSMWHSVEKVVDGRVVGRYISALDPWNPIRICFDEKGMFKSYPSSFRASPKVELEREDGAPMDDQCGTRSSEPHEETRPNDALTGFTTTLPQKTSEACTVEALNMRWEDIKRLVELTGALVAPSSEHSPQQYKMEVFTGMAVYLRTVATGQRYDSGGDGFGSASDVSSCSAVDLSTGAEGRDLNKRSLFAEGYSIQLWVRIFSLVQEIRSNVEKFVADNSAYGVEPEFELWEALIITLRCVLDFCAMTMQAKASEGNDRSFQEGAGRLFREAMELRTELIEESRTRFGGRMRVLWLQES
ncbi:hypothetical protein ERJ75_000347900 [Trypanosoma vivax]|nr:hypothetical protein TRVL_00860 [Trypanosoma vivax]KAH8617635.1 hypothetical protein ERJ75_000347900 [Trypanosoma vivax]